MTVDVNEMLAQQLAQPLINKHRHLLAPELSVLAYVGGDSVRECSLTFLKKKAVDEDVSSFERL